MNPKIIYVVIFLSAQIPIGKFNLLLNFLEYAKCIEIIKRLEIRHSILVLNYHHQGKVLGNLKIFSKEKIMTTAMSREKLSDYFQIDFFPNVNTIIIVKELNLLDIVKMFKNFENMHRFTWLVFVEFYSLTESQKLNIPYNCRFLIAYLNKENKFELIEVFKVKNQSFVSEFDQEIKNPNDYLYLKRINLNGTEIMISFDEELNERNKVLRPDRQNEIFSDIARMMNFKRTYKRISLTNVRNFTIDGDLCDVIHPFHSYFFIPDFLGPTFKTVIHWNIRYPNIENQGDYIKPLHENLWYCIFSFITFSSFALIVMKKIFKEKFSIIEIGFIGLDSLCNQEGNRDSKKNHIRLFTFSLRMMFLFMMPAYNAVITSFLAIRIPDVPFRNLEEFSMDGRYLLALPTPSFAEYYFKDSVDPVMKHINNDLSIVYDPNIVHEIIHRICNENLAFPTVDNQIDLLKLECDTFQIEKPITFTFVGLILRKNSPFKEVFNYKLIWFYTSGIQKKLQKLTERSPGINPLENTLSPVGLKQIIHLLFAGGIGIFMACVILMFEIFRLKFLCGCIKKQNWRL